MIKLSKIEDFFVNQTKNIVFVCTAIIFLTVAATAVYIGVLSTSTEDKITVAVSGQLNKFKELKIEEHNKKYKKQDINQKPETKTWNLDEEGGSPWATQTQTLPPPAHSPLMCVPKLGDCAGCLPSARTQ